MGMYQCVAGNKHGEVYSNAELRIIGKTLAMYVHLSICVCVCLSHAVHARWHGDVCAHRHLFSSLVLLLPLLNSGRWPLASLLLATNWTALIIKWMRPADSDVCQSCCVHQPHPSAPSSLSLSALGWQQFSFTVQPPQRISSWSCGQNQRGHSERQWQGQYQTVVHLFEKGT